MVARMTATRSRDAESAATRRAILAAAAELLASGGEDGLSIRELCARASVTPPTIYHHFGDKAGLVDRDVDECFADFDGAFARRAIPADPVEALRWAFARYVEFGTRHPTHYRLMFERHAIRPTPGALASYDGLRRCVAAIGAAGRLRVPVEHATAACWAALHGITSLAIRGALESESPAIGLVRESMISHLTRAPGRRAQQTKRSRHA
jgi:AcrR family transcriptional regulator